MRSAVLRSIEQRSRSHNDIIPRTTLPVRNHDYVLHCMTLNGSILPRPPILLVTIMVSSGDTPYGGIQVLISGPQILTV